MDSDLEVNDGGQNAIEQVDSEQAEAVATEKEDRKMFSKLFGSDYDGSSTVAAGFQKEHEMLAEEEDKEDNEEWELEVSGLVGATAVVPNMAWLCTRPSKSN